jgi:two-component system response regulator PilR (NtrC family)
VSRRVRILVVYDEHSMREFLEIFFRREGFDVVTAADVDAALLAVESDDFDVVISDVRMPGRSGLDLLDAVKEISPRPSSS